MSTATLIAPNLLSYGLTYTVMTDYFNDGIWKTSGKDQTLEGAITIAYQMMQVYPRSAHRVYGPDLNTIHLEYTPENPLTGQLG